MGTGQVWELAERGDSPRVDDESNSAVSQAGPLLNEKGANEGDEDEDDGADDADHPVLWRALRA